MDFIFYTHNTIYPGLKLGGGVSTAGVVTDGGAGGVWVGGIWVGGVCLGSLGLGIGVEGHFPFLFRNCLRLAKEILSRARSNCLREISCGHSVKACVA